MKDFIKWLGVNEKVAKIAVWMLIIMVFLIVTNTMLESVGFPHYAITYDNIINIDVNKVVSIILSLLVSILSFYSSALLVFRVKDVKIIFKKYIILYLILNYIINSIFGHTALQVFIAIYYTLFCYLHSGKKTKYILYGVMSLIATAIIQGVWYLAKARFIDYALTSNATKTILSLDYFIIMAIIILVKEIYLKKRGEIKCGTEQVAGSGLENSTKKANSLKKSQKKQAA